MQKAILAALLITTFLLGASLFRDSDVHAAKNYQYKVFSIYSYGVDLETALNSASSNGWEFVSFEHDDHYFIARK
jgi:hypothetical protein